MSDGEESPPHVSESRAVGRKQTRLSLVWIIPIVAAIAGAWVAVTRILGEGPKITIVFKSAEGLEAGKTQMHYNGVTVGTITAIRLSDDHRTVIATAQMAPKTQDLLVDDTHFWVVRPRISGATVSGLGTLISGAYIGMEIGTSKQAKRDFVALDTQPVVTGDVPGRFFVLTTPDLGSLDVGTPLYFRHLEVGQIAAYKLAEDGKSLSVRVFVRAPYDQYVTPDTRFWQASGVDMSLSASGLTVQTQSLLSILVGGVAFETPATGMDLTAAEPETEFRLFHDRDNAFKLPARNPQSYRLVFNESVRGLEPGAPVEFRGIRIGEVTEMRAQFDAITYKFSVPVIIRVDPASLGVKIIGATPEENVGAAHRRLIDTLVARGGRAQLRSGSLLTGALFVAIDLFPDAPRASVDWSQDPPEIPTVPGEVAAIEANVVSIIKKIDQMPIQGIGDDLKKALVGFDQTLASARGTLGNADKTLGSADKLIAPDSLLGGALGETLQEVNRMARSLRVLADYLERHPEALLRGKPGEPKQ
jgi:paraquat-inducible protein B